MEIQEYGRNPFQNRRAFICASVRVTSSHQTQIGNHIHFQARAFARNKTVMSRCRDHGGVIECDTGNGGTTFRILMPAFFEIKGHQGGQATEH